MHYYQHPSGVCAVNGYVTAAVAVIPVRWAVGLMAFGVVAILVGSGRHHRVAMVSATICGAVLATLLFTNGGPS